MADLNPFAIISVGCAIAGPLLTAYAEYEADETVMVVPPIRTYIGTDHLEVDITVKRLPPP